MMYIKTAILFSWCSVSYWLLIFRPNTMLQTLLFSISLGLAMAGIGFNVQHDGSHGAYSKRRAINRWMAMTLDMLGGSSYVWKWKHNYLHHNYTNLMGVDDDINIGFLGRLPPDGPLCGIYRYQYLYLWLAYGCLAPSWQFYGDFECLVRGRIGTQRMPRPRGWDLVSLIVGKVVFLGLMFVIPAFLHPLRTVMIFYGLVSFTLGWSLSVVFQLAHCVEDAKFPKPRSDSRQIDNEWAVHQVETTVDFARDNPLLTWYLGGLNFQVEHHLFPRICHLHYPALSAIVERVCLQFGVQYSAYRSMSDALASHHRFLLRSHSCSHAQV
jgi:linoleoyl-CoA desaturase